MFGIDYATEVTSLGTLASLRKGGVHFCARYISAPGNPKNLTVAERKALQAAGMQIVLVFETTANRALGGTDAGKADAISAQTQTAALGMPDAIIYFAVDFDASTQLAEVLQYFQGIASIRGHDRFGIYGGLKAVNTILNHGVCKYAWQTYAWSGGQWDNRAHLRQYRNGVVLYGVSCDYNLATADDFGQWPRPAAPVVVASKPVPVPTPPPTPTLPSVPDPTSRPGWPVWAYAFAAWLRKFFIFH